MGIGDTVFALKVSEGCGWDVVLTTFSGKVIAHDDEAVTIQKNDGGWMKQSSIVTVPRKAVGRYAIDLLTTYFAKPWGVECELSKYRFHVHGGE